MATALQPKTFSAIADLFHRVSGIRLADSKQSLVYGRLHKLALEHGDTDVERFAQRVAAGQVSQRQLVDVIDRLTTNETYFFREPQHFEALRQRAEGAKDGREFTVWSGASSSGEEAYSICMTLADVLGLKNPWRLWGTDLSTAMVDCCRQALYPLERARNVSAEHLKRYCRKGSGPYEGHLLISRELRERCTFLAANLMQNLPGELPQFDVIFLRNVLIYFDAPAKRQIVQRVMDKMKPGGVLFSGHAESLAGLDLPLRLVAPAVYEHA